jgi:hypothetical protein
MGRTLAFLARMKVDLPPLVPGKPHAVAVDLGTAVVLDLRTGVAEVVGRGFAYFLEGPGAPQQCERGLPLVYNNIQVYRLGEQQGNFDMTRATWAPAPGALGTAYTVSADGGATPPLTVIGNGGNKY